MQNNNKSGVGFFKKTLVLFFVLFFVFSPITIKKAEAQWVVFDPANFSVNTLQNIKDMGLDSIAWVIVNLVIERIAASTVNWINSGFRGSPAFVQDPEGFFKATADNVAGDFIFRNPDLNFLCGPLRNKIQLALSTNYAPDRRRWHCTLSQIGANFENFMDDFNQGGWNAFFTISQQPQNNPLGVYLMAENELQQRLAKQQQQKERELNWGRGFLSFKSCEVWENPPAQNPSATTLSSPFGDINISPDDQRQALSTQGNSPLGPNAKCKKERIDTPGSLISDKLNDVLNIGNDKLAVADEINEIVSALLNQLINRVVGGIGKGLRGLSRPDPANNNSDSSFTSQLSNRSPGSQNGTIEGYFGCPQPGDPNYEPGAYCDRQDTSILDIQNPTNPSSAGINSNNLVYPPANGGGFIDTSGAVPLDNDCNGFSQSTLNSMAQSRANDLGISFSQAMTELDCGNPGIN